jgi:hypothetical protein
VKKIQELPIEEDENWVFSGQPQIIEKEYQDVDQEKTSINKRYEVKALFYAKSLGWRGQKLLFHKLCKL